MVDAATSRPSSPPSASPASSSQRGTTDADADVTSLSFPRRTIEKPGQCLRACSTTSCSAALCLSSCPKRFAMLKGSLSVRSTPCTESITTRRTLGSRAFTIFGTASGSMPPAPPAAADTITTADACARDLPRAVGANGAYGTCSTSSGASSFFPSGTMARRRQLLLAPRARSSWPPSGVVAPAMTMSASSGSSAGSRPSTAPMASAAFCFAAATSSLRRRSSTAASMRERKSDCTDCILSSIWLSMLSCTASSCLENSSSKAET
mmetsp:Transcript_1462/g.4138  ORF Transcript_1462/g.4138 Transcript_1462/m.4138 type:complete len:265 (-) Transcript_1462:289-1083(-)